MRILPTFLFMMLTLQACGQQSAQVPRPQSASASSSAPGMVATSGAMTYSISLDGRFVTVSNGELRRSTQVDVVRRCGARGIGDPNIHDVEFTDTELRVTYAKHCVVRIPRDATGSRCDGCD
jgi:hypothetical protein